MRYFKTACFAAAFLLCACTSPAPGEERDAGMTPLDEGTGAEASVHPLAQITWSPCEAGTDPSVECGSASLPWDHGVPDGPRTTLRMRRSVHAGSRGQVWAISGGPGESIVDGFETWLPDLRATAPDLDVYAIDHRGVGGEMRLRCPVQEAPESVAGVTIDASEWPACIGALQEQWGENLAQFSTLQSVRDLHAVVHVIHEAQGAGAEERVFLWGGSYGTYVVSRYLQNYPADVDGAILEGVAAPATSFVGFDAAMNDVGHELMNRCAENADCASHFDTEPWEVLQSVLDSVDHGHCSELGADRAFYASFFAQLMFQVGARDQIPALVARLQRCNADDIAVWTHAYEAIYGAAGTTDAAPVEGPSDPLFMHVAISEMWSDVAPSVEQIIATEAGLVVSTGLEPAIAAIVPIWPRYNVDAMVHATPVTSTPLLFLQGELDPATPYAQSRAYGDAFSAPGQHFVSFRNGAHAIVSATAYDAGDCGRHIVSQFVADPLADIDDACALVASELEFNGNNDTSIYVLGTSDSWDGGLE